MNHKLDKKSFEAFRSDRFYWKKKIQTYQFLCYTLPFQFIKNAYTSTSASFICDVSK